MLRNVIRSATDLEKTEHRRHADEKAASWLVKTAKSAELVMDDDLKHEVQEKLAGTKRLRKTDDFDENTDIPLFKHQDDFKLKERNKAKQREQALKAGYDKQRDSVILKKFANSSFLTPEAAKYLYEAIKSK